MQVRSVGDVESSIFIRTGCCFSGYMLRQQVSVSNCWFCSIKYQKIILKSANFFNFLDRICATRCRCKLCGKFAPLAAFRLTHFFENLLDSLHRNFFIRILLKSGWIRRITVTVDYQLRKGSLWYDFPLFSKLKKYESLCGFSEALILETRDAISI